MRDALSPLSGLMRDVAFTLGAYAPSYTPSPLVGAACGVASVNLRDRCDKLFLNYDRGILTASEVNEGFVTLILDAPHDEEALELCDALPDWFRAEFRRRLCDLAEHNYVFRRFWIGPGAEEQIKADAQRDQAILKRLAPELLARS